MIDWLRDWWEGVTAEYLFYCAVASFILVGIYSCAMMPPQVVTERFRTLQRVHHQECIVYDSKSNCTAWRYWDTIEPQWVLVDDQGRECEVWHSTYDEVRRGQDKKCYQLYGWHNGVHSSEFPILERGW